MIFLLGIGFSTIIVFAIFYDTPSSKKHLLRTGSIVKTSGEVIDPPYIISTVDFDPDEFEKF